MVYSKSNTNNLNLLYLAFLFPPANAVASIRAWNVAKYLARLGWTISVVTPQSSLWRNIDNPDDGKDTSPNQSIKRILTDHYFRFLVPQHLKCNNSGLKWFLGGVCRVGARKLGYDQNIGWKPAVRRATSFLKEKDIDLILATGPPFCSFSLARELSQQLNCPYILDYRDLWTYGNPHNNGYFLPFFRKQEKVTISNSSAIITVSNGIADLLSDRFGVGDKIHVIPNGFDSEELQNILPHKFDHFAIVYTGTFYPPKRSIEPFMKTLKLLKNDDSIKKEWRFHYYGGQNNHVRDYAVKEEVIDKVVLHGRIDRKGVLEAVKGADIALVITSVEERSDKYNTGIITGKIFEAIGVGTPILLIAPRGSEVTSIIGINDRHFTGSDVDGMKKYIKMMVLYGISRLNIYPTKYAWSNLIQDYDAVLRKIVCSSPLSG